MVLHLLKICHSEQLKYCYVLGATFAGCLAWAFIYQKYGRHKEDIYLEQEFAAYLSSGLDGDPVSEAEEESEEDLDGPDDWYSRKIEKTGLFDNDRILSSLGCSVYAPLEAEEEEVLYRDYGKGIGEERSVRLSDFTAFQREYMIPRWRARAASKHSSRS